MFRVLGRVDEFSDLVRAAESHRFSPDRRHFVATELAANSSTRPSSTVTISFATRGSRGNEGSESRSLATSWLGFSIDRRNEPVAGLPLAISEQTPQETAKPG